LKQRAIRFFLFIAAAAAVVCLCAVPAAGLEAADGLVGTAGNAGTPTGENGSASFEAQLEASGAAGLAEALPQETQDLLAQIGVADIDLYSILNADARDMLNLFFGILKGNMGTVAKAGIAACGLLMLLAIGESLLPDDEKTRHALQMAGSILSLMVLLPGLTQLLRGAVSVVDVGSKFTLLLIPILAGIITAAGNPLMAVSYHSFTFLAAQGLSQLADNVIVPTTGVVLGLSFVDAATKDARLSAVSELIKKTVIGTFSILAGLFTALLSIKSLIANTADALAVRGVKVFAGSVPLVGGALNEAMGAILSSISLVKGAVGGFALLAALLLYAPILVQLFLWSLLLKLLCSAGAMFRQDNTATVFKSAGFAVSILSACVIFNAALLLISTGLVLTMKAGA
jgi:stage III sporulation protein AE